MPDSDILIPDWLHNMETILEELNEGVAIVNDQLRIVFANGALERMGRYEPGELQGRSLDAIFPAKDIPRILQQHQSGLRHGHSRSEFYVPAKNGDRVPAIFSGRSIRTPDRQEYALVTVTDISAQKHVEEQLRQSNKLLEQRQTEIDADLSLAERVQQSLAPQNLTWTGVSVEAYYSPARTIGGDFGVVFPNGDESMSVLMCDVSGHGIGSALIANRIYSETVHQLERKAGPGTLLRRVHDFVRDWLAADGFYFTMAAIRFTQRGRRAAFAAAGHPPAILVSDGRVRLLESQSGILGCLPETAASESVDDVELVSGDRLVVYTDGLTEVFNDREEMLGVEGLVTLARQAARRPLAEMKHAILDGVAAWRNAPLADDVSLLLMEVR